MADSKGRRTAPDGPDNFDIAVVDEFKSYVSSVDPTIADARVLTRGSQNVYKKISGTIANRCGKKLYDASTDATIFPVKSGKVFNTSWGSSILVRAQNGKLQFESAITGSRFWYDLFTGLTSIRFVFDTYWDNTDKKNYLLGANGTAQTVYQWDGGIGLFVSATATVITLSANAATSGFASSGSVIINGHTYTYTGISGSTLTGASDASAEPANSAVYSKPLAQTSFTSGPASNFVCDFIKVVNNQLHIGSYTSQLLYISKNTDYHDMSFSTPRLTGDGEIVLLDAPGKGIGVSGGNAHAFYGTAYVAEISFSQIAVGAVVAEQTDVSKIYLGESVSAQAHEFIDALSDNIIYLDQANQLRSFGTFRNIASAKAVLLSQAVQEELAEENFSGGSLKIVSDRRGDLVYINAPASGRTYLYQERGSLDSMGNVVAERIWQPPQTWNITAIDALNGRTIGFSNANPQIYYLWDTGQWYDDSPSGQLPYAFVMLFSYQNGGRRQGRVSFDKIYWEGYMTPGSYVYAGVYVDYQGATTLLSPIINDNTSPLSDGSTGDGKRQLYTGVTPPSLGDASLGDNPLGEGLNTLPDDQALVPKFRCITEVQNVDCFEFALMMYGANPGARVELLAFGVNETLSFAQGTELLK